MALRFCNWRCNYQVEVSYMVVVIIRLEEGKLNSDVFNGL